MSPIELLAYLSALTYLSVAVVCAVGVLAALVLIGLRFVRRGPSRFWLAPAFATLSCLPVVAGAGLAALGVVGVARAGTLVGSVDRVALRAGLVEALRRCSSGRPSPAPWARSPCSSSRSGAADPADYRAGFPWHPRRGIETITYVLAGTVEHGDSLGNKGSLGAGDVQWMTAGSGIMHQEMPTGDPSGRMHGFQLWANLPASLKMTRPRYQDIEAAEIPEVVEDDGTRARVIVGTFWGKTGPVEGVAADPRYVDVSVPAGVTRRIPVERDRNVFAYVFEGSGRFRDASEPRPVLTERAIANGPAVYDSAGNRSLVLFDRGDEVVVRAADQGIRFLLVSGKPLEEPVAWYGPIVMNTREQLDQAVADLRNGTFIK